MQFAALQYDIIWEKKSDNHAIVEQMLDGAALERGSFVVLPELSDTGFSFNLPVIVDDLTLPWARDLARSRGIWIQVGYAERDEHGMGRNCATIIAPDGDVRGTYRKLHPFSFSKESEHFRGGDRLIVCDCDGLKVCPLVCYDLRFPELWRLAVLAGAEVFTIGASWPHARQAHWRTLLLARAIENQAFVVGVNRVGADPNLGYDGGSMIISPTGAILAEADAGPALIGHTLRSGDVRDWRSEFPALRDVHRELLGAIRVN